MIIMLYLFVDYCNDLFYIEEFCKALCIFFIQKCNTNYYSYNIVIIIITTIIIVVIQFITENHSGASAHIWVDDQPEEWRRSDWLHSCLKESSPTAHPTRDTWLWLAGMAFVLQTVSWMFSSPDPQVKRIHLWSELWVWLLPGYQRQLFFFWEILSNHGLYLEKKTMGLYIPEKNNKKKYKIEFEENPKRRESDPKAWEDTRRRQTLTRGRVVWFLFRRAPVCQRCRPFFILPAARFTFFPHSVVRHTHTHTKSVGVCVFVIMFTNSLFSSL